MSRENLELVRRIYAEELFDREPDRLVERFAAADVEFVNPPEAVELGIRRGRAAVARAIRAGHEPFSTSHHELSELHDCGDTVVAAVSFRARNRGSDWEVLQDEIHTWTLRDGKIVRFEWGRDLASALAAARRPE